MYLRLCEDGLAGFIATMIDKTSSASVWSIAWPNINMWYTLADQRYFIINMSTMNTAYTALTFIQRRHWQSCLSPVQRENLQVKIILYTSFTKLKHLKFLSHNTFKHKINPIYGTVYLPQGIYQLKLFSTAYEAIFIFCRR